MIIIKDDYREDLDLLLQVFKEKPNFVNTMGKVADEFKKPQDCLFEIRDNFQIETAEGSQLDVIGKIQGIGRGGLSDTDYRSRIKLQIAINNGSGTPEDLITAIYGIYNPDSVQIVWQKDAKAQIIVLNVTMNYEDYEMLFKLIPAGVDLYLVIGSGTPFVFYGDDSGLGFNKMYEESLTFSDDTVITFSDDVEVGLIDRETFDNEGGELVGIF